jgi:hypothetical protein
VANYAWAYGRTWIPRSVYRKLKFLISNVDLVFNFMGIWVGVTEFADQPI